MDKFNLNIDKYSRNELFDLLNCKVNSDAETLRKCYDTTLNSIDNDKKTDNSSKTNLKTFLGKVYNKLKENDTTGINETLKQKQSYQSEKAIIDTPFEDTTKVKEKKIPVQVVSKDWTTGYVNPIQQSTVKKLINIDSRFRRNYYRTSSSDFTIELHDTLKNVTSLTITSSNFPESLYNISHNFKNNELLFVDISNNIEVEHLISIPYGIYNSVSKICSFLEERIQSATGKNYYTVNEVPTTEVTQNKIIFDGSGNKFKLNFASPVRPLLFNLGWMLGFRQAQYINDSQYFSDSHVDLNTYNTGYLELDTFDNHHINHMISNFPESIFGNNLIGILSLAPGNMKMDTTVTRKFFGPINVDKIRFKLLTGFGETLDLQQMDYSLVLEAICINE